MKLKDKRHLPLGRIAMTNPDCMLKRDITLPTKVHLVKAMVFPVVMYGCESWTIKKAKHWSFWTVVLEKTFESPLDSKKIKPVNPKVISPEYSLMLKLKFQYFCHLMWRTDSFEKTLMLGKTEDRRRRGRRRMKWLDGITDNGHEFEQALGVMMDRETWCAAVHGVTKRQTRLSNWTDKRNSQFLLPKN